MPGINGHEYQLATSDFTVVGDAGFSFTFETLRNMTYKVDVPKEAVKDSKGRNRGYVIKDEDTTGPSIRVLQSEWRSFKEAVQLHYGGTKGVGQLVFNSTVTYGDAEDNYMTDKLEHVMFQGEGRTAGNDQNALEIELALFILHVHPHGGDFVVYPA